MLTITSALALFILLVVSSVVFFVARRVRLPYTVLLVLVGLLIVPLVQLPWLQPTFGFLTQIVLTPELLFYIFLPMLIFESAFNMNMRRMVESGWSIMSLAIVGLLVSTAAIAAALYWVLPLVGLPIPFIVALLFGAIISSTDPVAVLALFKQYGAPKRLTLMFEGESLFNDGTALALFLVILAVAQGGFHGAETIIEGIVMFVMMLGLGIAFGIFMAALFSRALRATRSNEFVTITLLIVSAHLVFILSELINSHEIFSVHLHISPIIATTVAALFLGNYARHSLSPRSDAYLSKSIEHLAFVANSLVFLLAGILFATTKIDLSLLIVPILLTILVVALARVLSVYAVTLPLNRFKLEAPIPSSWQLLLSWGSLRGALAIIVVLLIPDNLTVAGWMYAFSPKELLLALTIGCILATLFLKAPTIGPLIKKLGIDQPTPFEAANRSELTLYYLLTQADRLEQQKSRSFIDDTNYISLKQKLAERIQQTRDLQKELQTKHGEMLFEQSLRHIAINIEIRYLKELYSNDEVSEVVYRRIKGKLNLQKETIERQQFETMDTSMYRDRKDVFDQLVAVVQSRLSRGSAYSVLEEKYQYYRAQTIIARKASRTFTQMQTQYGRPVFGINAYNKVVSTYEQHYNSAATRMEELARQYGAELAGFIAGLAEMSVDASGVKALKFFHERGVAGEEEMAEIGKQ